MKIKRVKAKTIKEGMEIVRKELGDDAVILSTKEIGGKEIEILAAKDIETKGEPIEGKEEPIVEKIPEIGKELKEIKEGLIKLTQLVGIADLIQVSPTVNYLINCGIQKETAMKINEKLNARGIENLKDIKEKIKEELKNEIQTSAIKLENKPQVVALVGPTGVGKTTTIAKLASNFVIYDGLKTSIITIDTYRLAAVEQIKTFANIVKIPVEVIVSPEEMPYAIEKFKESDVIFIDTAGRSQKDELKVKDMARYFEKNKPDEVHLVLSVTTATENLYDVIEKFSILNPNKIIFTKLDEVDRYGNMIDVIIKEKKPISYLTNGQSIPDAIEKADKNKIVDLILGKD